MHELKSKSVFSFLIWGIRSMNFESVSCDCYFLKIIFKDFIYLFLERGREGEREGEKHQCVVASHVPPTGDLARNPGMCPDWEPNWQIFGSQASAQYTEPHQPGLI